MWFPEDPKQMPWRRFLDQVAEAGYAWTELGPYGYLPTEEASLRSELKQRGLKLCGGAIGGDLADPEAWPKLKRQLSGVGRLLSAFDARVLILIHDSYTDLLTGEKVAPTQLDEDGWRGLIETTERVAESARDQFGLTLAFHPHAETHVEFEDQIEAFLADTDPQLVSLCLDTGHHAYCGGDPVRFMRKYHERIPYLHLKSVDSQVLLKIRSEDIPFAKAVAMHVMCEPSMGAVDILAFRDLLLEINYSGFVIVEQDMYPAPFDRPLPIAARTRAYLQEIGMG